MTSPLEGMDDASSRRNSETVALEGQGRASQSHDLERELRAGTLWALVFSTKL